MKEKFPIGFWNYTDCNQLDVVQSIKDWAHLGMTYAMTSEYKTEKDKDYILSILNEAQKYNIKIIICDYRTRWKRISKIGFDNFKNEVDQAIIEFGHHPAFFAFHIGDEPGLEDWEDAKKAVKFVNERSNSFINFYPLFDEDFEIRLGFKKSDYKKNLINFVKNTNLKIICYDCYTQCSYYNKEEGLNNYFENLKMFKEVSEECHINCWTTLLSVGHWIFKVPNEDDLRWQISTSIAHGMNGILWFFIYQRFLESSYRMSPINLYGEKTLTFDSLSLENRIFNEYYSDIFYHSKLIEVFHHGKIYAGCNRYVNYCIDNFSLKKKFNNDLIISKFKNTKDNSEFLVIVNNSQTEINQIECNYNNKEYIEWLSPGQLILIK